MVKIQNLIFDGQLTAQQEALSAQIDESLEIIMENPQGFWYDMLDIAKYKGMLKTFNEQFRRVFPVTKGLYAFQSDYYSIQSILENNFMLKVTEPFTFTYSNEVFRYAFLHEIGIYLHKQKAPVIYPVQIRAITIWLLIYYFDIKNFKRGDYDPILAYTQELMETEMTEIEAIWAEINLFRREYDAKIRKYNAEKAKVRGIVRKAKRCVNDRLMARELEFHHFMAQRVCHIRNYREQLNEVAKRYHLSLRTIKKRAEGIGFTEEMFNENLSQTYECYKYVELEKERAQKIIDEGPLDKSDTFGYYKKRFGLFRTFWSMITPEEDGFDEVQQREHERWLDEVNKSSNEIMKARVLASENSEDTPSVAPANPVFAETYFPKPLSSVIEHPLHRYGSLFDAPYSTRGEYLAATKSIGADVAINSNEGVTSGKAVIEGQPNTQLTEMTPEIVEMIMNDQSSPEELPQIAPRKSEPEEPDWERILAEIDRMDECAGLTPMPNSQPRVNIESVAEEVMRPSAVALEPFSQNPIDIEDVLDQIM